MDNFRVQISSEELPYFYGVLYTPTTILRCTIKECHSLTQSAYVEFNSTQK